MQDLEHLGEVDYMCTTDPSVLKKFIAVTTAVERNQLPL